MTSGWVCDEHAQPVFIYGYIHAMVKTKTPWLTVLIIVLALIFVAGVWAMAYVASKHLTVESSGSESFEIHTGP